MAGTKEQWMASMIKTYGSEEAVKKEMRLRAIKGGSNKHAAKGFGSNKELAIKMGRLTKPNGKKS